MSFQYFQPTLPKDKKTTGSSGVDLTHVDQNIVPIQHDTYCLGLEGTGNNSNQWKCLYTTGVQATTVTIGGTELCSPSSGDFNIGISNLCDIPTSPSTDQILQWTGSAFAWCTFSSGGYDSSCFSTDFSGKSTTDLSEGTNCYYTDARAQAAITGSTGVTVVSGAVSIPQTVATTSCPTFCNLTLDGDLTVSGACTVISSDCVLIGDSTITLNSDETGTPSQDAGLEIERGTSTNVALKWNETTDVWQVTCDGSTYNNIISAPDLAYSTLTVAEINDPSSNVSVSSVSQIQFDVDSGFALTDMGSNIVKIAMESTFKTWQVSGQSDLVAVAVDTIELKAGTNTSITTDTGSTPKSITFNSTQYTLPSQTSNSGKFLTTNGSVESWGTVDALPSQTGNSGKYLTTDGSSGSWDTLTNSTVGLGNVDNTADADKPISTSAQTALDLKAPIASPTFTGTVAGVTATHVGLGNVDDTSDANKPVSTATQTALNLKAPLADPAFTGTATAVNLTLSGDLTVDGTTTTINSTTLSVDDKNIELGSVATPTDATADGGGITLKGATDKTIIWDDTNDNWTSNQSWNLASGFDYRINNTVVLSSTTLQYLDASSSIQTQIDSKQASLTSGIADTNNVIVDHASVADDDYARFTASGVEGRSSTEVLSDIGAQASLTSGIADTNNIVVDSASVADDEYARFTASGLESRSVSEVLSDIGAQGSLTSGIADTDNVVVDSASVADDEYARFTASGLESRSTSEVLSDIGAVGLVSPAFTGTVTAEDFDISGDFSGSFLQDTTTTIEGTISEQKLVMADTVTLSNNLTVNDRLVLSQMQDDKYGLDAHVKLLIHSDTTDTSTTFTDSSRLGTHTITANGGAQHKTAQQQFGATSMYFDGTGDYLSLLDHTDWDFDGSLTIDFWVYVSTIGNYDGIITFDGTGSADLTIGFGNGDSKLHLFSDAGSATSVVSSTDVISTTTWHHIAITRDGLNTTRFFLDGNLKSSSTSWTTPWTTSSGGLKIGRFYNADDEKYFEGYLDEIRITKGVARWTASFTTPYKAYQDSTPAILTGGYTITGTGTIENALIDSTDQWEGSPYINTLGTILEGELTSGVTGSPTLDFGNFTGVLPVEVTGGSGLDAVPAAGVTGTLSNAVQDNITRLGTVTSGDISAISSGGGVDGIVSSANATAITIDTSEDCTFTGNLFPDTHNTKDLGSSAVRWANVWVADLHLANERGDWSMVEEEDYLTLRNNKTGKRFKLLMEELD